MNLIGLLIGGKKNTFITLLVGFVMLYSLYKGYMSDRADKALETSKTNVAIKDKKRVVDISDAINKVNFDNVQKSLEGTRYVEVELPEDYVDPDFGKIFVFGDNDE